MSRGGIAAVTLLVLAGGGAAAWDFLGPPSAREQLVAYRDTLRVRRQAADSCRRSLVYEEASFRAYDERVDSLRRSVRRYEALDPEGVPADSYPDYMEAFDRYNEAVPAWKARADSLQARWAACRALAEAHNEVADTVRELMAELDLSPEPESADDGAVRGEALEGSRLVLDGPARTPLSRLESVESDGHRVGAPGPTGGRAASPAVDPAPDSSRVEATAEDWRILAEKVAWARENGLADVPAGEAVARLGLTFVGTPYVPRTLEVDGPERTVVNLRGLDCVTLVETVLATVRVVRSAGSEVLDDPEALKGAYVGELNRIRYRDGVVDGYPSRLHYFSDWIANGEEKGVVRDVTAELGGVETAEEVHFMSSHPDAYRQLADPGNLRAIRAVERVLSGRARHSLPEARIAAAEGRIRTGDVIAATSTVPGLDVAHTGIAVRTGGALRLLHAPLVGDSVEVSEQPLSARILELSGQDAIMVARPLN